MADSPDETRSAFFEESKHFDIIICEEDLAYTAGLIDGEGCITILKDRNKSGGCRYVVRVTVKMCDTGAILFLKKKFGGGICKQELEPPQRPAYYWYLDGLKSAYLLTNILEYLRVKRRQAELAIEFMAFEPKDESRFLRTEMNRKESLYRQIRQLNKRGREKRLENGT